MDCGDAVGSLVVADKLDLEGLGAGHDQGYNLSSSLLIRLAVALEGDVTGWVDLLDYSASFDVEDHTIAAPLVVAAPTQDADVISIDLRDEWVSPLREIWDVDELPSLRPQPEHLYGVQLANATIPASDVDLVSNTDS